MAQHAPELAGLSILPEDLMQPFYSTNLVDIYNANCLDWMNQQADGILDLTVTSPPYDNIRNYKGYSFDFEPIARELYRITKEGGTVIWNVADATVEGSETGTSMRQALYFMQCGFRLHDTMIYLKKNPMPASVNSKRYHQAWEYIFVFTKGTPAAFNPIMVKAKFGHLDANMKHRGKEGSLEYKKVKRNEFTKVRNVFEYSVGGGHSTKDKIAHGHPAIMPEQLARDMIATWSDPGMVVYDPFMGSGTTLKMAAITQRRAIGTEMSQEYCELARARIELIPPVDLLFSTAP